jgi:hypothetical protein
MSGIEAQHDIYEGIDLSWNRIAGSESVAKLLWEADNRFNFEEPYKITPLLLSAYNELQKLEDKYWVNVKSKELVELIKSCSGIWTEAVTDEYYLTDENSFKIQTGIVNRSREPFVLKNIEVSYQQKDSVINSPLLVGEMINVQKDCYIPSDLSYTQPYWLNGNRQKEMYDVSNQILIGLAKNKSPLIVNFTLDYEGKELMISEPVYYRKNDPVKGEVYRSVEIVPHLVVNFNKDLYTLINGEDSRVRITVKCLDDTSKGRVKLIAEDGWIVTPDYFNFNFSSKNEEKQFEFTVNTNSSSTVSNLKSEIVFDDETLNRSVVSIDYPHIQTQTVIPVALSKIIKIDLTRTSVNKIGYIMGSGDKIPIILSDLGFNVQILNDEDITKESLKNFDAIIVGIRAYNTNRGLRINHRILMDYVSNGGTLVVQYNTFSELPEELGPFSLTISRDRVTEENSPVKILDVEHPLLKFPNIITEADFNGWIQERGLYFPSSWAPEYQTLLEMKDTNSEPLQGSLLYCKYGKGNFIYTGLSFFRQLPAGVTGAYNLFINLISAGTN